MAKYLIGAVVGVVAVVLAFFFWGSGSREVKEAQDVSAVVDRAVDGDTFVIQSGETVRIIGIDAPEGGECFAQEAYKALGDLVVGKEVRLEKDLSGVDAYGRFLRHAIIETLGAKEDNVHVGAELLRGGFARRAPDKDQGNNRYNDLLAAAQDDALEFERGLWEACPEAQREQEHLRQQATEPPSPECIIKGNVSEKGFGRKYYYPGCPNYARVKVDPERGDKWFCAEKEAQEAGFVIADNCPVRAQ